jgi:hypothetical protein
VLQPLAQGFLGGAALIGGERGAGQAAQARHRLGEVHGALGE